MNLLQNVEKTEQDCLDHYLAYRARFPGTRSYKSFRPGSNMDLYDATSFQDNGCGNGEKITPCFKERRSSHSLVKKWLL